MFCEKCNHELDGYQRYCKNCGNIIKVNNKDEDSADLLCILSLIIPLGLAVLIKLLSIKIRLLIFSISFLPLVGLVFIIAARIKNPKSVLATILMWIYIFITLIIWPLIIYATVTYYFLFQSIF